MVKAVAEVITKVRRSVRKVSATSVRLQPALTAHHFAYSLSGWAQLCHAEGSRADTKQLRQPHHSACTQKCFLTSTVTGSIFRSITAVILHIFRSITAVILHIFRSITAVILQSQFLWVMTPSVLDSYAPRHFHLSSTTLKMEAASSAVTSVLVKQYARRHIAEGLINIHSPQRTVTTISLSVAEGRSGQLLSLIRCPHWPVCYRILKYGAIHFGHTRTSHPTTKPLSRSHHDDSVLTFLYPFLLSSFWHVYRMTQYTAMLLQGGGGGGEH